MHKLGRLAQLARASRLHREGRGFESLNAQYSTIARSDLPSFAGFFVSGLAAD